METCFWLWSFHILSIFPLSLFTSCTLFDSSNGFFLNLFVRLTRIFSNRSVSDDTCSTTENLTMVFYWLVCFAVTVEANQAFSVSFWSFSSVKWPFSLRYWSSFLAFSNSYFLRIRLWAERYFNMQSVEQNRWELACRLGIRFSLHHKHCRGFFSNALLFTMHSKQ